MPTSSAQRFGHGVAVLLGRYDTPDAAGEISHKQALAAALSNTMGLGNIAGVALAIVAGGPGAVFWLYAQRTALNGKEARTGAEALAVSL